jgi:hypothetical protein
MHVAFRLGMKNVLAALFVIAFATPVLAQDASRASTVVPPVVAVDFGMGASQIGLAHSSFGSVKGVSLGLLHPSGLMFDTTLHVFPFKLRNIGFVTTAEMLLAGADGTPPSTIGTDQTPTTMSVIVGPEAQGRIDAFVFRAAALAGFRSTSYADFSSTEGRVTFRAQADWVFGDWRKGDAGLSLGTFASFDVVPALGWTWGLSFSWLLF